MTYHACEAMEILLAIGVGCPSEPYVAEMGPALTFAIQIMISFVALPPEVSDVNMSYATSATMPSSVESDQSHVALKQTWKTNVRDKETSCSGETGMQAATYRYTTNGTQLLVYSFVELNVREALDPRSARPGEVVHP